MPLAPGAQSSTVGAKIGTGEASRILARGGKPTVDPRPSVCRSHRSYETRCTRDPRRRRVYDCPLHHGGLFVLRRRFRRFITSGTKFRRRCTGGRRRHWPGCSWGKQRRRFECRARRNHQRYLSCRMLRRSRRGKSEQNSPLLRSDQARIDGRRRQLGPDAPQSQVRRSQSIRGRQRGRPDCFRRDPRHPGRRVCSRCFGKHHSCGKQSVQRKGNHCFLDCSRGAREDVAFLWAFSRKHCYTACPKIECDLHIFSGIDGRRISAKRRRRGAEWLERCASGRGRKRKPPRARLRLPVGYRVRTFH
jgi:hypothetical protein